MLFLLHAMTSATSPPQSDVSAAARQRKRRDQQTTRCRYAPCAFSRQRERDMICAKRGARV